MIKKITFTLTAFFLAATSLLAQSPTLSHGVWKQDYDALVTIYDSLNGDNWYSFNRKNWKSSKDVSEWANVKVANQRVVELNFRTGHRVLKGTVPNDINNLTGLRKLNFFYTGISKLPNNLSGLVSLVDLDLSYTQLSGTIPASLGNLKKLKRVNFEKSKFSGAIPSFAGCDSLEDLNLNNNQLSGAIPSFADCDSLVSLKLNNNQLTGAIPEGFGSLKKLKRLEFSTNKLSGKIPSDLGNSTSLEVLIFSSNQLEGKVPATLNNASKLNTLRLQGNKLTYLPDLSAFQVGTSITNINFDFANNYFDFADFERAKLHSSVSKTFSPQRNIKLKKEVSGKKITLTISDTTTTQNSYQWYRSKIAIAGATSRSYVITDSTTAESGEYYCEAKHSTFSEAPTNLTLSSEKVEIGISHGVFQQDYDALVAIYNALDGDNWSNKTDWLSDKDVEDWAGVYVKNNRVSDLNLTDNNLKGQIPATIEKLTGLEDLRFRRNKNITGAVPKEIGKLVNLTALHLNGCKLNSMPEEFKNLTKMKYCYLYDNLFESLPDLSGFTNLTRFRIHKNRFDFADLKTMNASVSNWHQYAPQDSIAISVKESKTEVSLTALDKKVANNVYQWYKDGTAIANANKQTFIISDANRKDSMGVYHCKITNSDFNKLTLHTKKTKVNELKNGVLGKDYNALVSIYDALNGDNWKKNTNWKSKKNVSKWLGIKVVQERVSEIVLNENDLKGTLPSDIGDLDSLKVLYMNWNELEGSIPVEIGNLKVLRVLDVYNNKLTGNIPTQIGNLIKLDSLDLSGNQLTGPIPQEIGNLRVLTFTSLAANRLSGPLPETVGNLTNLIKFTVENNELSGNLPTTIKNLKKVVDFWIYQNKFSGALPKEIGDMTKLGYFRADTNEFISIPKEIGKLKELRELWLRHNQLVGELPEEIGELTGMNNAGDIRLDDNKLTGNFPLFFTKLTGLDNLSLSTNQFSGTLPKEIGNFTALTNIDLDSNRFEGPVPAEIAIRTMQTLQLCNNQFTSLPDLSPSKFDFLLYCQVAENKLDFADLKKANVTISYPVDGYTYTPQDSVMVKITRTGSKVLLSSTDTAVINNVYQWYKDGEAIANANKQTFTINDVYQTDSMGVYHCQVTNSDFNQLTLYTNKTKLMFNTDATLADLKVNGKTVSEFAKDKLEYTVELPYGTSDVPVVTATATDSKAKVLITPANELPGETKIVVTAENETNKTYSVNFTITAPSADATLADLKVNDETVSEFAKDKLEYIVELPYGTSDVPVVTATATDSKAKVVITPANKLPGETKIVVTAENETNKTYSVNFIITAPSADATLADLKVNGETVSEFAKDKLEYSVKLPNGTTAVPTVSATATDSFAKVVITPANKLPGETEIVVTAQDTTKSKKYVVKFTVETGIADKAGMNFSAYPNPSTDGQLFLETSGKGSVQIMSVSGEMLQQFDIVSKKTSINISKSGVYILKYFNNKDVVIEKIIIQ